MTDSTSIQEEPPSAEELMKQYSKLSSKVFAKLEWASKQWFDHYVRKRRPFPLDDRTHSLDRHKNSSRVETLTPTHRHTLRELFPVRRTYVDKCTSTLEVPLASAQCPSKGDCSSTLRLRCHMR